MIVLLVAALLTASYAAPPTCAVLFCGDGDECAPRFTGIWVDAAQEESLRYLLTANGGFLRPECTGERNTVTVAPFPVPYDKVLCIDAWDLPEETCAFKKCNFDAHPELFESDPCADDVKKGVKKPRRRPDPRAGPLVARGNFRDTKQKKDKAACRTIASWTAIANDKLDAAIDAYEAAQGDTTVLDTAASYACVADFIFHYVNDWLTQTSNSQNLLFINDHARESQRISHVNSKKRSAMFAEQDVVFEMRAVQATLNCGLTKTSAPAPVVSTLAAVAPTPGEPVDLAGMGDLGAAIIYGNYAGGQGLDTPIKIITTYSGTTPTYEGTFTGAGELVCGPAADTASGLPKFVDEDRLSVLSPRDFSVTRFDGVTRRTDSLLPTNKCPSPILVDEPAPDQDVTSTHQALFYRAASLVQPDEWSASFEPTVLLRIQNELQCADFDVTLWSDTFVIDGTPAVVSEFRQPRAGVPLTLAPDSSVCVGGTNDGKACTAESECPTGWACQRKPFAPRNIAYCYDGAVWDTDRVCAFTGIDEECPFGACVGEVSGLSGGAYPFLWFYKEHKCGKAGADPELCTDERVANWENFGNPSAFVE